MSTQLEVSPKTKAQLLKIARREGIEPAALLERMVNEYRPHPSSGSDNELGGKTLGEVYGHLFGAVNFGPSDLSDRTSHYLTESGFGELKPVQDEEP